VLGWELSYDPPDLGQGQPRNRTPERWHSTRPLAGARRARYREGTMERDEASLGTAQPVYLTVQEVAGLLRLKERRVYALARSGALPSRRMTGRLLFPRAEIERWLARRDGPPAGAATAMPPVVLVGSHDPLLEWALRESGSGIASFLDGSLDGLARLARGEAIAAGLHLPPEGGVDGNRAAVEAQLAGRPIALLEWAWRERGLIVADGNPLRIGGLADLAGRRLAARQREAGSQLLLDALLARQRQAPTPVGIARSEADAALAVADSKADVAFGLFCLARQFRLSFVPVTRERYDLVVDRRAWFEPPLQRLAAFCRSPDLARKALELGGYDLSGLLTVRYNAP
jgi:putative molybdopterin biosynthesis protein